MLRQISCEAEPWDLTAGIRKGPRIARSFETSEILMLYIEQESLPKNHGIGIQAPPLLSLGYVCSLRSLGSINDIELYCLALIDGLVAFHRES